MMTDPPTIPEGVTNIYITYSDLAIHIADAGNDSGWYVLKSSGQIDLMGIINVTQTIATVSITSGLFNGLAFNVTSAVVTYQKTNYTADLVSQRHALIAWIVGGITISNGQTSAAVIDLTPTVMLLGTSSNPTFAFFPAAGAYVLPAQSISVSALHTVGAKQDIKDQSWWKNIETNSRFEITGLKLTPTSFSITVTNTGPGPAEFRLAAITSTVSLMGGFKMGMAAIAETSEIFVVEPNATLTALTVYNKTAIAQTVASGGYVLPSQATVTFTYSGSITIGILQPTMMSTMMTSHTATLTQTTQQITPGQRYIITIQTLYGERAQSIIQATSS